MRDFINLIKGNVKNYPGRIAVIDGDRKITYKDFINLVYSISHQLIASKSNPKVIIDLKQGIEAYALVVAVQNIGGTYCPLNPDAPIERKTQIIHEFVPDFIVTETDGEILDHNLDKAITIKKLLEEKNNKEIEINYDGESIIYIIYTSGTTGIPKGVMICRKAINKFLEWSIPTYAANETDIWGQFSSLSFDLSIVDIFTCLCSGATLFAMNDIPAKKTRPAGIIEKDQITIWHSIPSAVDFMVINEKEKSYDFSTLRLMSFCGEPLKKNQVEFLFHKKKDLTIFNTYGPTEGTLFCTWQELKSNDYLNYCQFSMCIGKAIPGWNLQLNLVEGFEEKEILIYGDYIGKGYLSSVNNEKFNLIEINGKNENSFQTGDLVNDHDGNLFFSSRKDRQVKIKGFRVELDEVDFRINEFLNKNSVTIVKKGNLYSFIETDENIDARALRDFLKTKLEIYKIPNGFYAIPEIPRTQNQKIDTDSLIKLPL